MRRGELAVAADAIRCPLKSSSVDAVLCTKVTHHLETHTIDQTEPPTRGGKHRSYSSTMRRFVSPETTRRMGLFVEGQLRLGAEAVVLVGTDSPTLPLAFIEQAFHELERADVVLGPATDGGYYLVGCALRLPPIFDGIAWSSSHVLAETVSRLTDPSWRLALLPPWYDVDTLDDWHLLRGHLAAPPVALVAATA